MPMIDLELFHSDSIWAIEPESYQSSTCFSGGRDGKIFYTDLTGDNDGQQQTLLFNNEKQPITSLAYDQENKLIWFTSSNDSSIKYIDFNERSIEKINSMQEDSTEINFQ